jgi:hypothetical protein
VQDTCEHVNWCLVLTNEACGIPFQNGLSLSSQPNNHKVCHCRQISLNIYIIFQSVTTIRRTLSETSNHHALCSILSHGNTLVQLLHCLSLSSKQLDSTLPPAAQLLLSQTQEGDLVGNHLRLSNALEKISGPSCELLYPRNISQRKEETFLYEYSMHWVLLPTNKAQQNAAFRQYNPQLWSTFWLLKTASEHEHARLLPRLSWSWTVLLPSDTRRKPITIITVALLPFVTYLLTHGIQRKSIHDLV